MSSIDRSLIAGLPLFAGLDAAALDDVLKEARAARFPRNTAVFEQGAEASAFFVLLDGHVRATKATAEGEQVLVRYVAPGEIFGVAQAIGLGTYPATATAVVDSVALVWPSRAWPRLTAAHPALSANAMRSLGGRLQDSHTRIIEMTTEQVERRVAHTLLRLVRQAGRKTERGIEIEFPISRQDIAEMTGTTLHTVSRTLSAWEQQGMVESGRQRIVVRDPHRLFALAEGDGA
ncbi:MAG: Crp/Fnr family transcriptional regulator [Rhodospirillaceae bacterium]|nr:Crp/Fnr family transcriptional regulator [Rhodospirillaceae bacterium]